MRFWCSNRKIHSILSMQLCFVQTIILAKQVIFCIVKNSKNNASYFGSDFNQTRFFFSFLLFTTKQNVFPIKIQNILMRKQLCKCLSAKLVQNEIDKNLLFRLNASRKESGALVHEVTSEI